MELLDCKDSFIVYQWGAREAVWFDKKRAQMKIELWWKQLDFVSGMALA